MTFGKPTTALTALVTALCFSPLVVTFVTAASQRIYLANDDHTDYMWSADAHTYDQVFVDMIDFHLALADETANNPQAYRARFNPDGSHWLWNYDRKKSKTDFERVIARLKDGTLSAPLNALVSCYGAQPAEAVLRGMYYAGRLERRYDIHFNLASATENQTLPLGLASLFAGAGAHYQWRGVCGCASKLPFKGVLNHRPREIYWYTGHDGQRQLMKWYSLGPHGIGGYWEAGSPEKIIEWVGADKGFIERYVDPVSKQPYNIIGLFGYGGDDLARKTGVPPPPPISAAPALQGVPSSPYTDHFHVIAEKFSNERRQIIVSNVLDFFADFEKHHGATLDSQTVTYGNEWDLYSASQAETSARVKRAVEKLRAAELLATLVSIHYPAFMDNHVGARDEAFQSLGLYWEHDWTADGPVTRTQRAAWHDKLAATIDYYVNSVYAEGLIRLGGMIPRPAKANRFFVLNPLGWTRTDFADFPYNGPERIKVIDLATGAEVPAQIVKLDGASFLRIRARDIPPAGYKVFEIRDASDPCTAQEEAAATASIGADGNATFENASVKLVVARDGSIRSFIDKRRDHTELAAEIDGLALNDFARESADGDALRVENTGPVSATLRARSEAGLPHTTTITLYRDSDRIDIRNEITANFGDIRHWTFSFNLDAPVVRSEEVGAINLNKLQSNGGDYADTHARYDYITLNHFADITAGDNSRGVTLSNADLAFAKLGRSTSNRLDTETPQINVLAGGQVDGGNLGIRQQNGATYFLQRFALRAHEKYDQIAAMKFALEHQNPLVAAPVISKVGGPCDEKRYSLLTVSNPDVLLWAVKPAEEGLDCGLIVRLWNVSDTPATTEVKLAIPIISARRITHIETDIESAPVSADGSVRAEFARQQIQTYRLNQ